MKKIILASAITLSVFASFGASAADDICGGGAAGNGTAPAHGTPGTNFMITAISPKCSANVWLKGIDGTSGAWYAVGAVSVKGKNSFKGNTNGGAVSVHVGCTIPGGCTEGEATAARTQANTDAQGST